MSVDGELSQFLNYGHRFKNRLGSSSTDMENSRFVLLSEIDRSLFILIC